MRPAEAVTLMGVAPYTSGEMKRHTTLLGAAAWIVAAGGAAFFLADASAGPPLPTGFGFTATHERPVAGQLFTGVVVVNRDPSRATISRVRCDAQVGTERLRGRQHRYFAPPSKEVADIACSWRIPVGAGGETLRLWHYRFGRRVGVFVASGLVTESHPYSWLVKR